MTEISLLEAYPPHGSRIGPPSPPKAPSPVYSHTSSQSHSPLPPIPLKGAFSFKGSAARYATSSVKRRPLPIPPVDTDEGAFVQQSPSAAVKIHSPVGWLRHESSSVPIEEHGSLLSAIHSRTPSGSQSLQNFFARQHPDKLSPSLQNPPGRKSQPQPGSGSPAVYEMDESFSSNDAEFQGYATNPPSRTQTPHLQLPQPSADDRPIPRETYQPLQYHHQPFEDKTAGRVDRGASSSPLQSAHIDGLISSNANLGGDLLAPTPPQNNVTEHSLQRPVSAVSSKSDLTTDRRRGRSPQSSPNSHARALSAHSSIPSPDMRPLTYVDLLNVPYPQPPPITAENLENSRLRNAVGNNASLLSTRQTLEMYRANVKKTNDPAIQYEFAVFMISAAQEANLEMENLSASALSDKSHVSAQNDVLKEARQILQRLSDRSYPFAQYYLADGYASGLFNKGKEDYDKAFPLFLSASKHGHAEAGYRAALCYEFGWGCRLDVLKAVRFFELAASKNHPGAMLRLGRACLIGDMGIGKRYREGVKWLKRASESADFQYNSAPYELGILHETGYGDDIFKDNSYAAQLFTKSADLGHEEANYRLGDAYEHGKLNCPRDPALSVHFYTGAAQRGHPLAQMALCAWYMVGAEPVLDKDENEAFEWAKQAAESGLAKAQYAVGYFTEMGIGCRRDPLEANVWYVQAADQGDERAKHRIAAIRAAAMGADPVTAALPNTKGAKVNASGSPGASGPDGEKSSRKRFGIFK